MTDCKNCKYTDEYCASGDCNKIQANDLACNKISLTEQWKKGELPSGWYWVDYYSVDGAVMLEYIPQHNGFGYEEKELVQAVLAPVPSYDELQNMNKAVNQAMSANIKLVEQNAQLKELLKECQERLIYCTISTHDVQTKIDEVLR